MNHLQIYLEKKNQSNLVPMAGDPKETVLLPTCLRQANSLLLYASVSPHEKWGSGDLKGPYKAREQ